MPLRKERKKEIYEIEFSDILQTFPDKNTKSMKTMKCTMVPLLTLSNCVIQQWSINFKPQITQSTNINQVEVEDDETCQFLPGGIWKV